MIKKTNVSNCYEKINFENRNFIDNIELTVENSNPLTRGFSLSKKVSIGYSNTTGIFPKSLPYKETGNKKYFQSCFIV